MLVAAPVVCAVLVLIGLARHLATQEPVSVTEEWLEQLSVETGELLRLVGEDPANPGPASESNAEAAIQRCRRVHDQLPRLKEDFKLICLAVKVIMVQSHRDRPDLAWALVRSHFTFACRVVQLQLARGRRSN